MRFTHFVFVVLFSFACHNTLSQLVTAVPGDTIELSLPPARGQIVWQQSVDGASWSTAILISTNPVRVILPSVPMLFRAEITEEKCQPIFTSIVEVRSSQARWSDPATWGGSKPVAGQNVTIPTGTTILLDEDPPELGGLTIEGKLEFDRKDLKLRAKWILVHGELRIGSEQNPFTNKVTLSLTGANITDDVMGMGTRGILVMGGTLELHGVIPEKHWTKVGQHANKNDTEIHLIEPPGWKVGDEIIIAPTDYYLAGSSTSITQRVSISAITNAIVTLSAPLNAHRWGLLQYPTPAGMSLSADQTVLPPTADTDTIKTPLVLDERAEVALLTRNIVIECPEDDLWINQGFGVHVMIMGSESTAHVEGVEIRRGGQRGKLARYPFHWHQLSYMGAQTLSDATGQYFRSSTIHSSANRGVVIHGTNGVTVQNNVIYDIKGHAVFTEDAVERRNVIDGNVVMLVRNSSQPLKVHEGANGNERGSSGFWISNPDNIITNNRAIDCRTNGFWLAFPAQPWGLNSSVLDARTGNLLQPNRLEFGVFDKNVAHSNRLEGIMLDEVEIDNEGNTFPKQYQSTINGLDPQWPFTTLRRFSLTNYQVWKNGDNGIWDRGAWPDNYGVVSADNCGRFFAGSGSKGLIERSLVVGTSLNHLMNGTGRPIEADYSAGYVASFPAAFATYHSTFDIRNNIVVNFPAVAGNRTGVFATDDYYDRPVDKGHSQNSGNLIIQSHPGVKLVPPNPYDWFVLTGALWDPQGIWGPPGNFLVYDRPYFTHGKTISLPPDGSATTGGVSIPGPFFGFNDFVLHGVGDTPPQNQPYFDLMGLEVKRLDISSTVIDTWTVKPSPSTSSLLQHMRHFATSPDGIYTLSFPWEESAPTDFQMTVENMRDPADVQVIGISFDGSKSARVSMTSYSADYPYVQQDSLEAVMNSSGETFWQDPMTNMVWVKIKGGRWQYWTSNPEQGVPTNDELLYEPTILKIKQAN